ncbi:MAG TPA: hypothetical protein VEF90_13935 [Xanthobacteraceae bacterium]|nr:hypothetical protein [Xanthobacteraceae bacterium]
MGSQKQRRRRKTPSNEQVGTRQTLNKRQPSTHDSARVPGFDLTPDDSPSARRAVIKLQLIRHGKGRASQGGKS